MIVYSVCNDLKTALAGIEHGVVNRTKLLRKYGEEAYIVTTNYNTSLFNNAVAHGVGPFVFSMYDYFQETVGLMPQEYMTPLDRWRIDDDFRLEFVNEGPNMKVFFKDDYIAYVVFWPNHPEKIKFINYFDTPIEKRVKSKREHYDIRGFLSHVQYFGDKERVTAALFFSAKKEHKFTLYYNDEQQISRIELVDYLGRNLYFPNVTSWKAFFLDELNKKKAVFFLDRSNDVMDSVLLTNTHPVVYPVLHSTHLVNDGQENERIKSPYTKVFNHLDRIEGLVVSTQKQANDVNQRLPETKRCYPIPVGISSTNVKQVPFEERNPRELISVARLSPEKQLDHQIQLIEKLVPDFPDIHLTFYGYGMANEGKRLKDLVRNKNLSSNITFAGYTTDLASVYQRAGLMLVTSEVEGFCLSLLEGIENGVPAIAYDIKYGPSDMITNNYNGFLVQPNNLEEMIEKVRLLLIDKNKQQLFSDNAYRQGRMYSEQVVYDKWHRLLAKHKRTI